MNKIYQVIAATFAALLFSGCVNNPDVDANHAKYQPQPYVRFEHEDWTKNASIYQINTRQFTEEGTLRAAAEKLERVKNIGTNIIWLMPIHPIGEEKRKGELGSPYAVRDFFAVSPELGTLDDLKYFVNRAHELGLYVILDWVANHTSWDNVIRENHPEWYAKDYKGKVHPTPWFDWDDIIELDYSSPGLRQYMTEAMKYWVKEAGIDGYRADAAGFVPLDFWETVTRELRQIKPVFMLAEWEGRDFHQYAFDATYAWSWWDIMHAIAQGKGGPGALSGYYAWNEKFYPKNAYRMTFVTNHDKNSWDGTSRELFGDALEAVIALSVIGEGMPLVYNGQEAGDNKRLEFFQRDPIEWKEDPVGDLYKKLLTLKKENTALWNGGWGATMIQVPNSSPDAVFSFVRKNETNKIFAVFNFSANSVSANFEEELYHGSYKEFGTEQEVRLNSDYELGLAPWEYKVFYR